MDDMVGYLLQLRCRARGDPAALRIIDRALALVGRARTADAAELAVLAQAVEDIAAELRRRYGPRVRSLRH